MHNDPSLEKIKDAKSTIKRIVKYLKKYKFKFMLVLFFIVAYITFNTLISLMLTPIIDNYIIPLIKDSSNKVLLSGLFKQILIFLIFVICAALAQYFQYYTMVKIAAYTVRDMRRDLFDKLIVLPIKYYDTHHSGELMSRITNDLDNVSTCLNSSIDQIVCAVLNVIVTLIVMISISPKLTLISVITIPVLMIASIIIMKLTTKHFEKQQKSLGDLNGYIEEYISGQKVIKAFNKEKDVISDFDKYNLNLRRDGFKAQAYGSVIMPVMMSLNNISIAIICIVSGIMAIKGKISIGKITSFNKFSRQLSDPINEISQQMSIIQSALAGAERVFEIMDEKKEFEGLSCDKKLTNVKGKISFENVNFGYDDKLVLKNFNLSVKPGETIAIVGPTGAGKTTIINLLTRFYDTNSGKILIDDKNIKDVSVYSLRNNLGIVLQDTVLFSMSVKDNLRFGKLNASDDEIVKACKYANADSFITKLPLKYDTILNEDVNNLSIGQKQLLNIARVILNNPKILILDEATSNVDTRTELKINEAMVRLMKGRTSFVIAHRLSTIRSADRIVVINDGRIVEIGNHSDLIKKRGVYFKMYTGMFEE